MPTSTLPLRPLSLTSAVRLSQYVDLERALDISIERDGNVTADLLRALHDLDPLTADLAITLGGPTAAPAAAPRFELMLVWRPQDTPLTYDLMCNGRLIDGGHGTQRGGRIFIPIRDSLVRPGENRIAYSLRFWGSGWKYQLWFRDGSRTQMLKFEADPDPSSSQDDRIFRSETVEVGGEA
jgi:hypothetical protein